MNEQYTAIAYEEGIGPLVIADEASYDDREEAIAFAKGKNWDCVRDDQTGEIIWHR